jgi:hypothetical protein
LNAIKKPWYKSDGFAYVLIWVIVPTVGIFAFHWNEVTAMFAAIVISMGVGVISKRRD